jgi:hypothetical protein
MNGIEAEEDVVVLFTRQSKHKHASATPAPPHLEFVYQNSNRVELVAIVLTLHFPSILRIDVDCIS